MPKDKKLSIVSINPYTNETYICIDDTIKKFTGRYNKKNFYISFLNTKDFITTYIDISKNIPPEDIQDLIELKAYEELDLDQTVEYIVDYFEKPSLGSDKDRHFMVFAVEKKRVEATFEHMRTSIPYIDSILPSPLLFRTLYNNEILDGTNVDLFIYIQREDAFLAIYQHGLLIYSKSLKYSFEDMAERLSELTNQEITAYDVMKDLESEGLKIPDLDKLHLYMKVFSEFFMHINDVLIYAKRANNIETIDNIFFSSEIGFIEGFEEYCQTYLAHEAYGFNFDYGCSSNEPFVEDLHYLLALTAKDILLSEAKYPNFTIFPKPAPFFKRPSGELTLIVVGGILLGSLYPAYNYIVGLKFKYEASTLSKRYPLIHAKRVALERKVTQLKKELEEIKHKSEEKQKSLQKSQQILNRIYDKKVHYVMKAKTIADLSQDLVKFKLLVNKIENNDTTFDFNLTATDDKQITKFIKHISDNKADKYDISTNEISKTDLNGTLYNSIVEVKVK